MRSAVFWEWFEERAPKLSEWVDRASTFRKMFEHLDQFDAPVIVETGCIEEPDNWAGNGCSTILFDRYVLTHPGAMAFSFEIDHEKVRAARRICSHVTFDIGNSVDGLISMAEGEATIDLLYLDASHHDWVREAPSQAHHFNELMAAMPMIHKRTLVAIDDSQATLDDYPQTKVSGKGGLIAQHAYEIGAKLEFCTYQVGFTGMTNGSVKEIDIGDLVGRAREHVEAGEQLQADWLYRLVMGLTPPPWVGKGSGVARLARAEACAHFGRNAHKMKRYGLAIDWFRNALEVDPLFTEYRCDLVRALVALESMPAALREAKMATEMEPDSPRVWATLGGVYSDSLDGKSAIEAYDRQVEAAAMEIPTNVIHLSDAYINRAAVAVETMDYETARRMCKNILAMEVKTGDAWQILAMIEYRTSNHEKDIELYDKALENDTRNKPLCHWNKSLALQAIGRLKESWTEHVWRQHERTIPVYFLPYVRFAKPVYGSGPHTGPGVVHVHTEAGHGDNIAMLRYLPLLQELNWTVRYECDPSMLSLAQRCFPDVVCMPRAANYPGTVGIPNFDYHMPIGDLPHAFGTDIDSIPWRGPYLKADPDLAREMAERLPGFEKPLPLRARRIGLCWSSGIRRNISIWMQTYGRSKSMPLKDMVPLFGNPEDVFISLQIGDGRDEIDHRIWPIYEVLSESPSWDETAAVIENLDLVITVDTSIAHLAGAMGKPCWVVMKKDGASWHFMCERPGASWNEASPWYPSVRVFRQSDGTWASAIEKVAKALGDQQ